MCKWLCLLSIVLTTACKANTVVLSTENISKIAHNDNFFTQGLLFHQGNLYETTGRWGESAFYAYSGTQHPRMKRALPQQYFGEGLAIVNKHFYWLSWKAGEAWKIDSESYALVETLRYTGQGWGLTTDGQALIMSNGSSQIVFRNPSDFSVQKTLDVRYRNKSVPFLNELEWIEGFIYANVWKTDDIVKIDPTNGKVVLKISAKRLRALDGIKKGDVLNGIAYHEPSGKTLLTGKNWPFAYWVELP